MRLKHVHIIGRVSICVVLVAALVSCQPLSSKRTTGNSSRKQSKTDSTTVKPDLPEGTGNPFTAVTPIDSSTLRRKIPTLREQMEKLQMQQDYTNAKLDSLRAEIATVKAAVAQREESPKQQPASSKTLSPKQQKQNEAAPVVTDLRGEKPGAQKKEQPKKIKQDLPPDEEPTI
ncbi:MAG: hypothetical protein JNL32_16160, partial [Candidatus Kapabacteria bacterium]|nr:hypothetical protein [Candidatus Kapabacteria bacterium]